MLIIPLTAAHVAPAVDLLELCNRHEGLDLPITFEKDPSIAEVTSEFVAQEGGQLVGFAALPNDPEPEACLTVHPDYRRRGIGRALLAAIRAECTRRGLDQCLLVSDEASPSGQPFLKSERLPYLSSEYRLELDRSNIDRSQPRCSNLVLRPATLADRENLISIRASGFGTPLEEEEPAVDFGLAETKRCFYIADLDDVPVGMIRAGEWDGNGDLTSFAVLPEHRGRGFGRHILLAAVDLLIAAGWRRILIEVATDNANALGLYESCGFQVTSRYGFYRVSAHPE